MANHRSGSRRAVSGSLSRDHARLKNRKKRITILKRRRRFLLLGLAAAVSGLILGAMAALGFFDKPAEETTLTLKNDGTIVFEEIETSESGASEKEVVDYAKETIEEYNEKVDEKAIHFGRCSVSDGQIYLKTTYRDAAAYADFTGLSLFEGTASEAAKEGYLFNETMVAVKDGEKKKQVKKTEVKESEDRVMILNQPIRVVLPSPVKYLSRDDTQLISPNSVKIENPVESYIIYE
ncbi:MAG: hypothetical protein IJV04_03475 [Lachnospiraceae bacterium]|nr:hypothetical protein [Lachnospiraceae bacterium]